MPLTVRGHSFTHKSSKGGGIHHLGILVPFRFSMGQTAGNYDQIGGDNKQGIKIYYGQ